MHLERIVFSLLTLAACGERGVPADRTPADPPLPVQGPLDPALFARDQPMVSGLQLWGDTVVVRGASLHAIDLASASASPLTIEGADAIDVARSDVRVALVRTAQGIALMEDLGGWRESEVPAGLRTLDPPYVRLAADASYVAAIAHNALHVRRGGRWSSQAQDPEVVQPGAVPNHVVIADGVLYAGYDRGEWGGSLIAFDVTNGRATAVTTQEAEELALPVKGLARASDGRLWIARGLAHLGLQSGRLGFLRGDAFTLVSRADALPETPSVGWNLEPEAFDAMAIDASDRLYVATGSLGVVRRDGDTWTRLTPGWPSQHVYVTGLLVIGDTIVIATSDSGVLLFDIRTGTARRVTLVS